MHVPQSDPPPSLSDRETLGLAWRTVVVCAVTLAAAAFAALVVLAADVWLLLFAALLVGLILGGLADVVERYTPLTGKWSLALVVVVLLLVLLAATWSLAPLFAPQIERLREVVPQSVKNVEERLRANQLGRWLLRKAPTANELVAEPRNVVSRVTGVVSSTIGGVASLLIVLVLGLFFAAQRKLYIRGLLKLVPPARRGRASQVMQELGTTLRWWLVAKFISMAVVAVLTSIGLSLLGVELAGTLGIIAGLLSFIPNFGPILGAIPAVLIGMLHGPMTAVYVVAMFAAVQLVETNFITPFVELKTVSLPPALSITVQLLLGLLVGGVGVALAAPLATAGMVLVQRLYVEDFLGDRQPPAEAA